MTELALKLAAEGNLVKFMGRRAKGMARAVTSSVKSVTFGLQKDLKRQVKRAKFKSDGLERTIKGKVLPRRGFQPDAEGVVYTRAMVKRGNQEVDLVEVFDKGAVIRAPGGKWLAIPTNKAPVKAAGKSRVSRYRPAAISSVFNYASSGGSRRAQRHASRRASDFSAAGLDSLHFVPSKNPNLASLQFNSRASGQAVVAFWLVREVRLRKRIDIRRSEQKWLPKLEPTINKRIDRMLARLETSAGLDAGAGEF